ncbi:10780_t:CDS:2 [Entrophospora sp. SA101]|nr:10780_t:CDS:2 [Entrophospora sp. SA101]
MPSNVNDNWITRKLRRIEKGIARYGIIYLPECNKKNELKSAFSNNEWSVLEKCFYKKEKEIAKKVFPLLNKVETILGRYQEGIKNAEDNGQIDLDAINVIYDYPNGYKFRKNWLEKWVDNIYQKFLTCFHLPRNVLNDRFASEYQYRDWIVNTLCKDLFLDSTIIRMAIGEVENEHQKTQLDLSKNPDERKSRGWCHDGILNLDINGVETYVGILEVVGNAVVKDNHKLLGDRQKLLKAMRLAFHELHKVLYNDGVVDENIFEILEPIPITKEKAIAQEDELKMTKRELIIKSKNKDDLLVILQEVRCLFNEGNEIDDSDSVESSN